MWVAQEWRRTWGLTLSARPTRPAYFFTTPKAPTRVRRPPRALRNTASASLRRRHFVGSSSGRPCGREPVGQGLAGAAAERHDAFLVPLAEHAQQGQAGRLHGVGHVAQAEADRLAHPGPGAVEHLEQGAVAQHQRAGAHHGTEQLLGLLLAQRLGQQVGHRDRRQVARSGRPRARPPRPGSGGSPACSRGRGRPTPPGGCGAAPPGSRRHRPRWPRPWSRPRRPAPPRRRPGRAGTTRACAASAPARPRARTGTPRPAGAAARSRAGPRRRPGGPGSGRARARSSRP